jgi:tRNA (guanine-N7-)-methyltransferase
MGGLTALVASKLQYSPRIVSNQADVHPRLEQIVTRHLKHPFLKPPAVYTRTAYETMLGAWGGTSPLIIDAGCGTGDSTLLLAQQYSNAFVVGVDQSAHRLAKAAALPENALLLRADVTDFWRLLHADQIKLAHHCWFYPNPWPKAEHVQRRWYAHPAFAAVLALGGRLEVRSNWQIFTRELAASVAVAGLTPPGIVQIQAAQPISLHERKYRDSQHALYQVVIHL